ncbi:uncharacterized protein ACIBXB_013781 isoform 1-T2 [Morphnus guianensis]
MHVFLTISPAGCKSADEELETETSPAPKSKPPSLLQCRRPAPAQHRPGSAPSWLGTGTSAGSASTPRPVHALEREPSAKRARMRPAQPVVQQHGAARGWEMPGFAAEQRMGCWAAVGHGSHGLMQAHSLPCKLSSDACTQASKLKTRLGALPPPLALRAAGRGSHGPAWRWPGPRPPGGPACSPRPVPGPAQQLGAALWGHPGGPCVLAVLSRRSSQAGGPLCLAALLPITEKQTAALPPPPLAEPFWHAMAREGGCRCPRGPLSPTRFSLGAQEGSGEVRAQKQCLTSSGPAAQPRFGAGYVPSAPVTEASKHPKLGWKPWGVCRSTAQPGARTPHTSQQQARPSTSHGSPVGFIFLGAPHGSSGRGTPGLPPSQPHCFSL